MRSTTTRKSDDPQGTGTRWRVLLRRRALGRLLLLTTLAGCGRGAAWGDANSIIVATSPELWREIQDTVQSILEPRIRTVTDERMFKVTFQDPARETWRNLRRFRQMLLIGSADQPWMAPALEGLEQVPSPPAMVQAKDVWARGQLATVLLLPEGADPSTVAGLLPELRALYERQYREWALGRMFISGQNTALADTLSRQAGFSLVLPNVYRHTSKDSVHVFKNDNPDPSELIRQVAVTWRSGEGSEAGLASDSLLAWRRQLSAGYYTDDQVLDLSDLEAKTLDYQGQRAYQLRGVWQNPPGAEWPAAGPFILRGVACPSHDRFYLLDAWLYAPGREKYEYIIQLETILDSFRCVD